MNNIKTRTEYQDLIGSKHEAIWFPVIARTLTWTDYGRGKGEELSGVTNHFMEGY